MTTEQLESILNEAATVAVFIEARKERAMIYQADAKEALALSRGLPRNAYHFLPYDAWLETQKGLKP